MRPLAFADCVGWLHGRAGDVGVVVCNSLANEAGCAYFSLRVFAERLAEAGYPVLRFDYAGTGDAADTPQDDPLPLWQRSVQEAADALRRHTGARRVVFAGLRVGALLAALAAEQRRDIAGLIQFAPVIQGRRYVRELRASSLVIWKAPPQLPGWLETDGMAFADATIARLDALDLRHCATSSLPQLILAEPGNDPATAYAQALRQAGASIAEVPFTGYAALVRPNRGNAVPHDAFEAALTWLRHTLPAMPPLARPARPASPPPLQGGTWQETPLCFGSSPALFGILCRPVTQAPGTSHAVVIGNTGMDPHQGYGRFHVELARHLAARGIATLRFDFPDLGDSPSEPAGNPSHPYAQNREAAFAMALSALEHHGFQRFTLAGICSGATHAWHAARSDPRVGGLALINLETLHWQQGHRADTRRSTRFYLHALRSGLALRRLRAGQLDVLGVARILAERTAARAKAVGSRAAAALHVLPAHHSPAVAWQHLTDRGVAILLVMGLEEPGLDTLATQLGPRAKPEIDPSLDHALSRRAMREAAANRIAAFVEAWPRPAAQRRPRLWPRLQLSIAARAVGLLALPPLSLGTAAEPDRAATAPNNPLPAPLPTRGGATLGDGLSLAPGAVQAFSLLMGTATPGANMTTAQSVRDRFFLNYAVGDLSRAIGSPMDTGQADNGVFAAVARHFPPGDPDDLHVMAPDGLHLRALCAYARSDCRPGHIWAAMIRLPYAFRPGTTLKIRYRAPAGAHAWAPIWMYSGEQRSPGPGGDPYRGFGTPQALFRPATAGQRYEIDWNDDYARPEAGVTPGHQLEFGTPDIYATPHRIAPHSVYWARGNGWRCLHPSGAPPFERTPFDWSAGFHDLVGNWRGDGSNLIDVLVDGKLVATLYMEYNPAAPALHLIIGNQAVPAFAPGAASVTDNDGVSDGWTIVVREISAWRGNIANPDSDRATRSDAPC